MKQRNNKEIQKRGAFFRSSKKQLKVIERELLFNLK
jgi:hypothetical protein